MNWFEKKKTVPSEYACSELWRTINQKTDNKCALILESIISVNWEKSEKYSAPDVGPVTYRSRTHIVPLGHFCPSFPVKPAKKNCRGKEHSQTLKGINEL